MRLRAVSFNYCHGHRHRRCSITHSLLAAALSLTHDLHHSHYRYQHAIIIHLHSHLPVPVTTVHLSSAMFHLNHRCSLMSQVLPCLRSIAKSQTSFSQVIVHICILNLYFFTHTKHLLGSGELYGTHSKKWIPFMKQ